MLATGNVVVCVISLLMYYVTIVRDTKAEAYTTVNSLGRVRRPCTIDGHVVKLDLPMDTLEAGLTRCVETCNAGGGCLSVSYSNTLLWCGGLGGHPGIHSGDEDGAEDVTCRRSHCPANYSCVPFRGRQICNVQPTHEEHIPAAVIQSSDSLLSGGTMLTKVKASKECLDWNRLGYEYSQTHDVVFKVYEETQLFVNAIEQCKSDGGYLARPKTRRQQQFYKQWLSKHMLNRKEPYMGVFIGVTRDAGQWTWQDGSPYTGLVPPLEVTSLMSVITSLHDCLLLTTTPGSFARACCIVGMEKYMCELPPRSTCKDV